MQSRPVDKTSDALHNKNCYRFIQALRFPSEKSVERLLLNSIPAIEEIYNLKFRHPSYDSTYPYGVLYTRLMSQVEEAISKDKSILAEQRFDDFFMSLYDNDNHNLAESYDFIKGVVLAKTSSSPKVQEMIEQAVQDQGPRINPRSPADAGSATGRFVDMVYPYFKPSHQTSLSTVRQYRYSTQSSARKKPLTSRKELRFGTQGQTHAYASRVSPLFERYLAAQARTAKNNKITHVYFNNLGKDRSSMSYEGRFETGLTRVLHSLEDRHQNVAVITLPADKGLMSHHDVMHTHPNSKETPDSLKEKLLQIATESSQSTLSVKDFHISKNIRALLFTSTEDETRVLTELLDRSFRTLDLQDHDALSPAQSQAVWVHFLKFELPTFILDKLSPVTFNFSCKDAIDRGGISSAYYNLLTSFKTNTPMDRDEFEQALHAAPLMVKGRGMNDHLDVIWNAVDLYMQANPDEIHTEKKKWLVDWRDANCPRARAGELLDRRLQACIKNLEELEQKRPSKVIKRGLEILRSIPASDKADSSHHALLLEVVTSTHALCVDPALAKTKDKFQNYAKLAEKMKDCYPAAGNFMVALYRLIKALIWPEEAKVEDQLKKDYQSIAHLMGPWKKAPQIDMEPKQDITSHKDRNNKSG